MLADPACAAETQTKTPPLQSSMDVDPMQHSNRVDITRAGEDREPRGRGSSTNQQSMREPRGQHRTLQLGRRQ